MLSCASTKKKSQKWNRRCNHIRGCRSKTLFYPAKKYGQNKHAQRLEPVLSPSQLSSRVTINSVLIEKCVIFNI